MKSAKRIIIKTALILIGIGILISLGALASMDFNFDGMNSVKFVTNTYTVHDAFTNIYVNGAECDVRLLVSEDGICKVDCSESDKISHIVTVENDTLRVERKDNRKWYEHMGVYWGRMEVAIYLPQTEYDSLYIKSLSGGIEIPENFSFAEADIHNTSGSVKFSASVRNELSVITVSGKAYVKNASPEKLSVQSTSGSVEINSAKAVTELKAKAVSGKIELSDIECQNISAESTSGKVAFSNVTVLGNINIESVSGSVVLSECDAGSLWIKTTSGSVSGTLLSEKAFITDTVSGNVDVPRTSSGGKCEITTTSGNIKFSIK